MATGRVYKRGNIWYLDYYTGTIDSSGKRDRVRRATTAKTKSQAQAELNEIMYGLRRGKTPFVLNNAFPVADLAKRWKEHIDRTVPQVKTACEYKLHIDRMLSAINIDLVSDLTMENVERAISLIAKSSSTNTANKSLNKLKAILDYGIKLGLIASNAAKDVRQLKTIRKKFRRDLSRQEIDALMRSATDTFRPIWFAYLCTGAREAELVNLRVEDVDLEKQFIRIRESAGRSIKTTSGNRTIPINNELCETLKGIMPEHGFVFGTRDGVPRKNNLLREFRRHMAAALKSLGKKDAEIKEELKRLDIHSLRYTFITELIAAGVDPKSVQHLAGHKNVQTTLAIYAQCRHGNAAAAVGNLPWTQKT